MQKNKRSSSHPAKRKQNAVGYARRKLYKQAALMLVTIVMTVVLLFAMTTAWYTNVIQTGALVFEAETWGFEGEVLLAQSQTIQAAPGDEGVVELTVTNNGDYLGSVTVNISKEFNSATELMSRIYFYVEESAVVNEETVQKQYLSNTNGHTYTLFSKNTLILTEKLHTDTLIRWEWVYDMVGYYFRGTKTISGDNVTYHAEEYLRPVEYDYDEAIYNDDGTLKGINEDVSAAEYIAELTATDGYAGKLTAVEDVLKDEAGNSVSLDQGCYLQIELDEENSDANKQTGVWLYLCPKSVIESNNAWDTKYGSTTDEGAQAEQLHARITVTGHQIEKDAVKVSDPSKLEDILNQTEGGIIQLDADMVLPKRVTLTGGADVMLDLNGHQITFDGTGEAFKVTSGAELTVLNGSIKGNDKNAAFKSIGGQLTLSNVKMDRVYNAVQVNDHETTNAAGDNSIVRIVDCEWTTTDVAVLISGDGTASGADTTLVIQKSKIDSGYIGISGNGSETPLPGRWGTDIQIIDSEITGLYAGVYHPQQQSRLTISNSTISGITGIVIKGGHVDIVDSVINGTGNEDATTAPTVDNVSLSGFVDTGDGIYMETNYDYPITLTISGDSLITSVSASAYAVRMFPEATHVRVEISGGTFSSELDATFLAEGYTQTKDDKGIWTVVKAAN